MYIVCRAVLHLNIFKSVLNLSSVWCDACLSTRGRSRRITHGSQGQPRDTLSKNKTKTKGFEIAQWILPPSLRDVRFGPQNLHKETRGPVAVKLSSIPHVYACTHMHT